jgi:hypothetical protein
LHEDAQLHLVVAEGEKTSNLIFVSSQVMKVAVQQLTGYNSQVIGIVSDLVSVHHRCWHLNGALKVEIVAAKVVCELFDLALAYSRCVFNHKVVHWEGSSNRGSLSYHIKVEGAISISGGMLNEPRIDNSARSWVGV